MVALHELAAVWILDFGVRSAERRQERERVGTSTVVDEGSKGGRPYLVGSRPYQSISAQVATNVGRDDLTIYAITRHKIHILARLVLRARRGVRGVSSSCHDCVCAGGVCVCLCEPGSWKD